MKAALLEAPRTPIRIYDDVEIADPGPGQVRVRVAHCGLCHSDVSFTDGTFPSPLPIVLGHEASGVVDAIGPHVDGLALGDPVVLTAVPPCGACWFCARGEASLCVQSLGIQTHAHPDGRTGLSRHGETVYRGVNLGAFAEYVVSPARGAIPIPRDVPLDVAAVIGCAVQTGVGAVLNTAGVVEGDTVLVVGLGGVGLSVVQGARLAGAARIIASDPVAARRDAARAFGATDVIDPSRDDLVTCARDLTGIGVDFAFEAAGRGPLITQCMQATRNGGTTVCVGAPPLSDALDLGPAAGFLITGKRLVATVLGGCNSLREIPRLLALWKNGRLDLEGLVTARRPLDEINEAVDDLVAGRGIRTMLSP